MAWFKFHDTFWDHYKTLNACRMLKIEVYEFAGKMAALWSFTGRLAWRDGNLEPWGVGEIERRCGWTGKTGEFVRVLQECGAAKEAGKIGSGFLDGLVVHDWNQIAGDHVTKRRQREEGQPSLLEEEEDAGARATYAQIQELWNKFAADNKLPQIQEMTRGRREKLRVRGFTVASLQKILASAGKQDFLMGRLDGKSWKMDFDWLLKNGENAQKVMEGKYLSMNAKAKPGAIVQEQYEEAFAKQKEEERAGAKA